MLLKTAFREIKTSLGRYLAILAIIALGVGFFAGLRVTRTAMISTADHYLKDLAMFDDRILSTLGWTEEDVDAFQKLDGRDISRYDRRQLTEYRRRDVGFVFQFYNLIQNLTALENVEIAAQLCPHPLDAAEVLREVGLGERMKNFPAQLSGGEQQRVAIARALAKNPKLLLCDEPTGALDYVTGKNILKLLQDTCRRTGMTVVIITHNSALTAMADRVISIKSGTIQSMRKNEHVTPVEEIEW